MKMNYPLISEYIESISSAEDNFEELSQLRPVLDDDGLPVMTSGNFAVVFKMMDERDGKFYAVKCFTKEQEERAEAYKQITEELKDVESPYLISVRYLDKELFVDTKQTIETEFPVLLMDWVEGKTLDKYLRENLEDKYALEMLAYRFSQLAQWLVPQPFAHGDLKPDNILVREDGTLVLVDYDGMYVPAMKGQKARELGSPDFRHPLRTEDDFDEHIDDFPLISILLSLKAISLNSRLLEDYGASDRLLFSEKDYKDFGNSSIIKNIFPSEDRRINLYVGFYSLLLNSEYNRFHGGSFFLPPVDYSEDAAINTSMSSYLDSETSQTSKHPCNYSHEPEEANKHFSDLVFVTKGIKYSKDMKCLLQCPDISDFSILEGTIIIGDRAFYKCRNLEQITIPDSVEHIGNCAFYWCDNLKNVIMPNSVKHIGGSAFFGCKALKRIIIPEYVKYIGGSAFSNCEALIEVTFLGSDIIIEPSSFFGCKNLARINIPIWSRKKYETLLPKLKSKLVEKRL